MSSEHAGVQSPAGPDPERGRPDGGQELSGFAFIGTTALFFGAAPTFAKLAFDGGIDALSLQVFRFAIAFVAVIGTMAIIRETPKIQRHQFARLTLLACCTGIASLCYMTSVRYVPVAVASLTFFTFPIIVGPLSHLVGSDRMTVRNLTATAVAFTGLCMVLGGDLELDWLGILLAFIAGLAVALSFIVARPLVVQLPAMTVSVISTGLSGLFFLTWALFTADLSPPETPVGKIGLIGNSLCYAVGLCCLYAGIRRIGALRSAILVNAEPLISVLAAFLVLGQTIGPVQIAGTVVVIFGITMVRKAPKRDAKPDANDV